MQWLVGAAHSLVGEQFGDRAADVAAPAGHGADGVGDLFGLALFVQVAAGALAQQGGGVVHLGKAAEDQYRQVGESRLDRRQGVNPALVGHRDVQQQHVDLAAAGQLQRLFAVAGLARDAQIHMLGQILGQAGTHDGVVVDDADSDHGCVPLAAMAQLSSHGHRQPIAAPSSCCRTVPTSEAGLRMRHCPSQGHILQPSFA